MSNILPAGSPTVRQPWYDFSCLTGFTTNLERKPIYKLPKQIIKLRRKVERCNNPKNINQFMKAFEKEAINGCSYCFVQREERKYEICPMENCVNINELLQTFLIYYQNCDFAKGYMPMVNFFLRMSCTPNFIIGILRYKILHLWLKVALEKLPANEFDCKEENDKKADTNFFKTLSKFSSTIRCMIGHCYSYSTTFNRLKHVPEYKLFLKKFSNGKIRREWINNLPIRIYQEQFLKNCGKISCFGCGE